jgi:hypothetical protein
MLLGIIVPADTELKYAIVDFYRREILFLYIHGEEYEVSMKPKLKH